MGVSYPRENVSTEYMLSRRFIWEN